MIFFSGVKELPLDNYLIGTSRTFAAKNLVTDSAAGATTFACGKKTYNEAVAVDVDKKPLGTILETAQKRGMKTGTLFSIYLDISIPRSPYSISNLFL